VHNTETVDYDHQNDYGALSNFRHGGRTNKTTLSHTKHGREGITLSNDRENYLNESEIKSTAVKRRIDGRPPLGRDKSDQN